MIRREGDRMWVTGPATLLNVTELLALGMDHVRAGVSSIDLAEISALDSSLLAALLAWMREARSLKHTLVVTNPPKGLLTLAQLYGVAELLPVDVPR